MVLLTLLLTYYNMQTWLAVVGLTDLQMTPTTLHLLIVKNDFESIYQKYCNRHIFIETYIN